MFVNNPLSGLVIFGGLVLQNYWWALNGFVGTLFATISALILQQNRFKSDNKAPNCSPGPVRVITRVSRLRPQRCHRRGSLWLQWHPGGTADGCVLQQRGLVLVAPPAQHFHVHDVVRNNCLMSLKRQSGAVLRSQATARQGNGGNLSVPSCPVPWRPSTAAGTCRCSPCPSTSWCVCTWPPRATTTTTSLKSSSSLAPSCPTSPGPSWTWPRSAARLAFVALFFRVFHIVTVLFLPPPHTHTAVYVRSGGSRPGLRLRQPLDGRNVHHLALHLLAHHLCSRRFGVGCGNGVR